MNLNNISQIRYGGKDIVLGKLNGDILYKKESDEDIPVEPIYPYEVKFRSGVTKPTTYNYCTINGTKVKLSDMSYDSKTSIYTYNVGAPITSIRFNGYGENSKRFGYNNILELIYLDISNLTNMSYMFSYCGDLTSIDLSTWDTSNVTDMSYMFYNCENLTSIDLSTWDISKVNNVGSMFSGCKTLTSIDLSTWDTSKVNNAVSMLYNTPLDIDFHYNGTNYSKWTKTEENCSYRGIFQWNLPTDIEYSDNHYIDYCVVSIPAPLDYLNVKKLGIPTVCLNGKHTYNFQKIVITKHDGTTTSDTSTLCNQIREVRVYYPENCEKISFEAKSEYVSIENAGYHNFLRSINSINVDNFTDMSYMFAYCFHLDNIYDLSNWDTSNVTNMSNMFYECEALRFLDLSNWDTSSVTDMSGIFGWCYSLTELNLSNWDTSNVTDMNYMFYYCRNLDSLDLSSFNTSNVTNMSNMFYECEALRFLDLSNWDTSSVTDMSNMFGWCSASIYGGYKFAIKGSCNSMFEYFSGSIYDIGYGEVQEASYMFANSNIDDYTFSNIFYHNCNFSGCSNMSYMFYNCTNLSSLYFNDSSYHNTQSLYDTSYMFAGCTNLYNLYIDYMYTHNVYNYEGMFADVPDSCTITVRYNYFTLNESDTGFNGTFNWEW